jgi:hypothetical protein
MSANLELWKSVEKTDPSHTKAITGKQYKGTSPQPYYLVRKATETFGPCGIGWGYTVEERVEDGAAHETGCDKLHIERGEVTHIGGTPFSGRRKDGTPYTDEDAPKKSVTDALVKALSMLGFAGDIFIGRYDDSKYVADTREEFQRKDAGFITREQGEEIRRQLKFNSVAGQKLLEHFGVQKLGELPAEKFKEALEWPAKYAADHPQAAPA